MRYNAQRFFFILVLAGVSWCAAEEPMNQETAGDCSACHSSNTPSNNDLIPVHRCMRTRIADPGDTAKATPPDVVTIGQISELYVPVVFPHGLHAKMEAMSDGCGVCHHHNEGGKVTACRTCHDVVPKQENLRKPGLKGAYHRQCMSCHREWSHTTDCVICHAKRVPGQPVVMPDPTDITGRLHPNVAVPDKRIFPTPNLQEGTMVTFHHKDHVEQFGGRCADCHRKENCGRCHDQESAQKHVRQDPHEDCAQCHDTSDKCDKCHLDHEAPPFDHGKRTSFMLNTAHDGVSCAKCHTKGKDFSGLKQECITCHPSDWFPEKFDHSKTGLVLSESHKDTGCAGCHPKGLGKDPDCTVCHEDKKFPDTLPGTRVPEPTKAPDVAATP